MLTPTQQHALQARESLTTAHLGALPYFSRGGTLSSLVRSSTAMATPSQGDSAATLLAKLQARNRVEVDAFRAVFEAHAGAQRQARVLQERVATLNRRCAELSEGKEKAEADLKTANEAAAKGTAVKDQSARISELQTELAASYK